VLGLWESITSNNPWWDSKDKINLDVKIEEINRSKISWDPRIRKTFNYHKDLIYSLRGPRQVGKTTLIKIQIREFLEDGVNPWNIMYYAFDIYNTPKDLVEIVKTYFNQTAQFRSSDRHFLFLDEISSIKDWQRGIKTLWDENYLKNCTVVVTGSHTVDLQRSTERLAGRRGDIDEDDSYDKIFLPMKFSEYVSILDSDLKAMIDSSFQRDTRSEIFYNLLNQKIDNRFQRSLAALPKLNTLFQNYLLTGGIPKVINEYLKSGKIESSIYNIYFQSIIADIHSLDADESIFKRLINHITERINFTFSFRDIQKNIDVGSSNTVERYINLLCSMFVLINFYRYDANKKERKMEKPKKIHFHDPFFFHTLYSWTKPQESFKNSQQFLSKEANQGPLVEGVVGDHLIRLIFHLVKKKQMFDYSNYLFYWQDKNNYEVDYILCNGTDIEVPIEVKYTNSDIKKEDINGIINFERVTGVKNAILITKETLRSHEDYVEIPASIFLLLI
jgi:uncharacterized protein